MKWKAPLLESVASIASNHLSLPTPTLQYLCHQCISTTVASTFAYPRECANASSGIARSSTRLFPRYASGSASETSIAEQYSTDWQYHAPISRLSGLSFDTEWESSLAIAMSGSAHGDWSERSHSRSFSGLLLSSGACSCLTWSLQQYYFSSVEPLVWIESKIILVKLGHCPRN